MKMQMKLLLIQRLASACLCMNIGKGGHGTVNLPLELYHDCPTKNKHMTCTVSKFQDYLNPSFSLT